MSGAAGLNFINKDGITLTRKNHKSHQFQSFGASSILIYIKEYLVLSCT
jgi:hypothetical protein